MDSQEHTFAHIFIKIFSELLYHDLFCIRLNQAYLFKLIGTNPEALGLVVPPQDTDYVEVVISFCLLYDASAAGGADSSSVSGIKLNLVSEQMCNRE